jgi:hypothetical protein
MKYDEVDEVESDNNIFVIFWILGGSVFSMICFIFYIFSRQKSMFDDLKNKKDDTPGENNDSVS